MRSLYRTIALFLLLAIIGSGSYYLGYRSAQRDTSAANTALLVTSSSPLTSPDLQKQFDIFWEAWQYVEKEYYDTGAIDHQKMIYGAIKGMVQSLADPHSQFVPPAEARITDQDIRGSFDGIGVELDVTGGKVTVVAPLDGTPSQQSGLRPGDVIARIDGKDTAQLSLVDAVGMIRGPRGTSVQLSILRDGERQPLAVEIVRAEIRPASVQARILPGKLAYIKLTRFTQVTGQEMIPELRQMMQQRPAGLILDLRNNPGGLLDTAVQVASQYMNDGVVLYQQRRQGGVVTFPVQAGGVATDVPLVVLVNQGSASAAEIVAGALQDSRRAVLVGEHTYGKDSVQTIHRLADDSSLRLTFARWWTPKKQDIHGKGLTPDILVSLSEEDLRANRDPQLERAIQYLGGKQPSLESDLWTTNRIG